MAGKCPDLGFKKYANIAISLFLVFILLLLLTTEANAKITNQDAGSKRLFLILVNDITIDNLISSEPHLYNLQALLKEKASIGLISTRTAFLSSMPSRTLTTLGAGNRATGVPATADAVNAFEEISESEGRAVDVYYRRTGYRTDNLNGILHLGISAVKKENTLVPYNVKVGLLAEELKKQGVNIAVYGNSDRGFEKLNRFRTAAMVAVDPNGQVAFGNISSEIDKRDPSRPFGIRTGYSKIKKEIDSLPQNKSTFIVIDSGDTSRAAAYSKMISSELYQKYVTQALIDLDRFIESLIATYGFRDTTYMLVAASPPLNISPKEELTPVLAFGDGFSKGLLKSPTTRRNGIVALTDLAPTIIERFNPNFQMPEEMTGRVIGVAASDENLAYLSRLNKRTMTTDRLRPPLILVFIVMQLAAFIVSGFVLWFGPSGKRMFHVARFLLMLMLALPVSLFITAFFVSGTDIISYIIILTVLLLALSLFLLSLSKNALVPILLISVLTFLIISVDVLLGAKLNMNSILGYSPIIAGRFYGIGNQAMSVLLASSLILIASFQDMNKLKIFHFNILQLFLFGGALVIVGLPVLGANVGGTITLLAAYWATYVYYKNKKIDFLDTAKAFMVLCVFFSIAVGADLMFNSGSESHLTRIVSHLFQEGGFNEVGLIVQRKLLMNWKIFRYSSWSYLFLIIVALFILLRLRPPEELNNIFDKYPALHAAATGCLVGSLVGFMFNDSGSSIPALILAYLSPIILYLMVSENQRFKKMEQVNG